MAAYEFLGSEATLQVLSPDLVRDAQRITARAAQSQVVYSLVFAPYPTDPQGSIIWTPELIDSQLAEWAGHWNDNAATPGVAGISVTQEVDGAGTLKDVAFVTVTSTSGLSFTTIPAHPRDWLPDVWPGLIGIWVQHLDAVEKGTG